MAVANIDTVYQRVLALANKEQRGYITPQEFNLLAGKAQNDIFEMYFHDYKTALLSPGNQSKSADDIDMLKDKIRQHRVIGTTLTASNTTLPSDIHYLESIYYINISNIKVIVEEVDAQDWLYIYSGSLVASKISPMTSRPVFIRSSDTIVALNPANDFFAKCDYIKRPVDPKWGYVVVGDKALYNSNTSTGFELHASEESTLTNKILELAGIVINKPGLSDVILRNEAVKEANENK